MGVTVARPMLATSGELPHGPQWAYELKWDGVRVLAVVARGRVRLYARSGAEVTRAYPELAGLPAALAGAGVSEAVLDGEIVLLDPGGRPSFQALAERMHVREAHRARQLATERSVHYMIFDVLSANGSDISTVAYQQRREWLELVGESFGAQAPWVVPPRFADGPATLLAAKEMRLEGVVAKRLQSTYRPGVRSPDWVKVKHELSGDYVVGGWRSGARELASLLIGLPAGRGRLHYRGRVGGGISVAAARDLLDRLRPLRVAQSPFVDPLPRDDSRSAYFTRPKLVVEVRYGQLTQDGRLRFPRLVRLRLDKSPQDAHDG